jgi:hypothetical protein
VIRERISAVSGGAIRISDAASDSGDVLGGDAMRWMAASLRGRRRKRRSRHAPHASQLRTGAEASCGGNAGRFAAARCLSTLDCVVP